jgi:hypothetical protein
VVQGRQVVGSIMNTTAGVGLGTGRLVLEFGHSPILRLCVCGEPRNLNLLYIAMDQYFNELCDIHNNYSIKLSIVIY